MDETSGHHALANLSIKIGGPKSEPYKSISELQWDDIPPFTVLTGPNGSGKSQLLELIAYKLVGARDERNSQNTVVEIKGDHFGPEDVAYVPYNIQHHQGQVDLSTIQNFKNNLHQQLRQRENYGFGISIQLAQLVKRLGLTDISKLSSTDLLKLIPDDMDFTLEEESIHYGMCQVFMAYRMRLFVEIEKGLSKDDAVQKVGIPPWDLINQAFEVAGFPYRIISPVGRAIGAPYALQFEDVNTGTILPPH